MESGIPPGELGLHLGHSFLNRAKDRDGGAVGFVEVGKEVSLDVDNSLLVRKAGAGDLLWDPRSPD